MTNLLCALFAVCAASAPVSAAPTWEEVAPVAVPLVARWEGLRTTAYLDTIASPAVWTICYGQTQGVTPGEARTREECEADLREGLRDYWRGFMAPLTMPEILTANASAAFTSLAWNIGIRAINRSTVTRRLNNGDLPGACKALTWWTRAGQRVVRGLVNRRAEEYATCITR